MSKDGGPAFPVPGEVIPLGDHMSYVQHAHGMSMRDYFAAAALTGLLAGPSASTALNLTEAAYDMADAMLRAADNVWRHMDTAPRVEGEPILLLSRTHGVVEARWAPGEWSSEIPGISPREYSGPVWVCGDDAWQIEVEETPIGYLDGEAIGWLPRNALPTPPMTDNGWQDISTAPKDGTRVLLIDSVDRFPWIGSWNANLGDAGLWQEDGASLPDYQPEYWSPAPKLPTPPTEKDKA